MHILWVGGRRIFKFHMPKVAKLNCLEEKKNYKYIGRNDDIYGSTMGQYSIFDFSGTGIR